MLERILSCVLGSLIGVLVAEVIYNRYFRGQEKMGKMSREKGKRGERELASKLREYGYDARRGQQYCGANGDADVTGLPGLHVECKRTERLELYEALAQARNDTKEGEIPVVAHRRNNCEWVMIIPLECFMEIYREWEAGRDWR